MKYRSLAKKTVRNKKFFLIMGLFFAVIMSGCSLIEKTGIDLNFVQGTKDISGDSVMEPTTKTPESPLLGSLSEGALSNTAVADTNTPTETAEPTPTVYSLELWVPPQFDTEQDTASGKALSEAIKAYVEENPNVTISLRVKATSGDSSMLNTIISASHIAPDVLPSMALISRNDMETAVQRGLLQPVTTTAFSDISTWNSFARQSSVIDNTIYSIPIFGDDLVITYRKSRTGTDLGDWADILGRGMPIGFAPSSSSSLFAAFVYLSMGGKLTNDQGQPYLDQQKLTETLNFFLTGGQNGSFPPSIAQMVDQTQVWQRFNEGTLSIIISPFSSFRHYQNSDITMHPIPLSDLINDYPLVNTWNLVLLEDDSAVQEEAIKFAEYLSSISVNDQLSYKAGYLPVRNGAHEAWADDPQQEDVIMMSENAALIPNNQIINKLAPIINSAVSQVIKNQATPEDAAKDAIANLN